MDSEEELIKNFKWRIKAANDPWWLMRGRLAYLGFMREISMPIGFVMK